MEVVGNVLSVAQTLFAALQCTQLQEVCSILDMWLDMLHAIFKDSELENLKDAVNTVKDLDMWLDMLHAIFKGRVAKGKRARASANIIDVDSGEHTGDSDDLQDTDPVPIGSGPTDMSRSPTRGGPLSGQKRTRTPGECATSRRQKRFTEETAAEVVKSLATRNSREQQVAQEYSEVWSAVSKNPYAVQQGRSFIFKAMQFIEKNDKFKYFLSIPEEWRADYLASIVDGGSGLP